MVIAQRRIGLLFTVFAALLGVAALRALELGTVDAAHLSGEATAQQVVSATTVAPRGTIFDRNGDALAVTEPADDIAAVPYLITNPDHVAHELAPLLGVSATTLASELAQRTTFEYLARQLPAARAQRVAKLALPGISLSTDNRRIYPFGTLAAQLLGGVHSDGAGAGGIEAQYNRQLAGRNGESRTVYAANGQPISVSEPRVSAAGASVQLTLDAALQADVQKVVAEVGAQYSPEDVSAVAMVPQSGAVLAMANWPFVNANNPGSNFDWSNHAIALNYEPGSTFKIVAIAGALSDGLISPNETWNIPSTLRLMPGVSITDSTPHPDETLTTSEILAESSNIGAVEIGRVLGPTRFNYWVHRFGFGSPTGIDVPGENAGIVIAPSNYSGASMANLPIGQGESVTPMQISAAYAAIANGGILRSPHIVQAVGGVPVREPAGHRILSPQIAAEMRSMLEGVLEPGGTASEITIPGYTLAGKTGTANKAINGVYSDKYYVASFVGFAPAQDPKIEVTVVVDQPKGAIFGTEVAAPAWGNIMSFALPYLKIPPG
jgi:cell division protein FtsI/penicillin-binding protein 2